MPSYCVQQIIKLLNENKKNIKNTKIAILGYSFKNNSGDIRFSPIISFVETLIDKGFDQISVFDSFIGSNKIMNKNLVRTKTWEKCVKDADVIVFGAAHDDINSIQINILASLINKNAIIFDGRRYFEKRN